MSKTVCFTGHRPKDMVWQYDESHQEFIKFYTRLSANIEMMITDYDVTHFITGMAMGVDTWAGEIVAGLKSRYPHITLESAIPCLKQESKWHFTTKKRYYDLLEHCDKTTIVTNTEYTHRCMQVRNEYMVDNSDIVFAVWNGKEFGGTFNCIKYARSVGKKIVKMRP